MRKMLIFTSHNCKIAFGLTISGENVLFLNKNKKKALSMIINHELFVTEK